VHYRVIGKFRANSDEKVVLLDVVGATLIMGQINGNNRHGVGNAKYLFYSLNENRFGNFPPFFNSNNFFIRIKVVCFILFLYERFDLFYFKSITILFRK